MTAEVGVCLHGYSLTNEDISHSCRDHLRILVSTFPLAGWVGGSFHVVMKRRGGEGRRGGETESAPHTHSTVNAKENQVLFRAHHQSLRRRFSCNPLPLSPHPTAPAVPPPRSDSAPLIFSKTAGSMRKAFAFSISRPNPRSPS